MSTSFSFKPSQRLNSAWAFTNAFEKGKRFHLKNGTFIVAANEQPKARLGLIIAKKKVRLAVDRHYLKRIIREGFRMNQHHLQGYDLVFIPSQKIAQWSRKELWVNAQEDWELLRKRLKKS